jgi:hypothetical protein
VRREHAKLLCWSSQQYAGLFDKSQYEKATAENVIYFVCLVTWSFALREEYRLRVFVKKGPAENIWSQQRGCNRKVENYML